MGKKANFSLSLKAIPDLVLMLVFLKMFHILYIAFVGGVPLTDVQMVNVSIKYADGLLWLPIIMFLLYFYFYRKGKVANTDIRSAVIDAMIAIVPKMLCVALYMRYNSPSGVELISIVSDVVIWLMVLIFLISYWSNDFKMKNKHHHRHHHHHSK